MYNLAFFTTNYPFYSYCFKTCGMMILILMWISLISLITGQYFHGKEIKINTTGGSDNTTCCVDGECVCTSLSTALHYMTSSTVINITSESVALEGSIKMGSGDLNNIKITGNGATIMCNNSGGVYCESCDNVVIEGITWDKCGDPNGTNIAGVAFNKVHSISLLNCIFQHSQIQAVSLLQASGNVKVEHCSLLSNKMHDTALNTDSYAALSIKRFQEIENLNITISNCAFYDNGYWNNNTDSGVVSSALEISVNITDWLNTKITITISMTTFSFNSVTAAYFRIEVPILHRIVLSRVGVFNNNASGTSFGSGIAFVPCISFNPQIEIVSSNFSNNYGSDLWCLIVGNNIKFVVNDSYFIDNKPINPFDASLAAVNTVGIFPLTRDKSVSQIVFYNVHIINSTTATNDYSSNAGVVYIATLGGNIEIHMIKVKFISNQCLGDNGGAVYIEPLEDVHDAYDFFLHITQCEFINNVSPGHGAALYVYGSISNSNVLISNTLFESNIAGSSIVYIAEVRSFTNVQLMASSFTNNVATSMYLPACDVYLMENVIFKNNTGDNGAALYLSQGTTVNITKNATVWFDGNLAAQNGGAIYIDLIFNNQESTFLIDNSNSTVLFTNNSAEIAGNSLYFNIPKSYKLNVNISDGHSIMHVPCTFNYYQPVDGTMIRIPCDFNYTLLHGTGFPIVTSPHELRLYFPNNDGGNISSNSDHNIYYIKNNILGHDMIFAGSTFDYFGNPSIPTQFTVECINCSSISLQTDNHLFIDNITNLTIKFKGNNIRENDSMSVTLKLTSTLFSLQKVRATLIVELVPCVNHPGNKYSNVTHTCVCYHHDVVECSDAYNEIKRGYWFGSVNVRTALRTTTSLCPNHYCNFNHRKETRQGYFKLPTTVDAQCNDHRTGSACGECNSPGYTLSYDSTDCISVDHCSAGMTVLVVVLTCLYWIVVVVGVFSLMYFNFQISSGYLYGIIYYYSVVGILLDNNPYVSDTAFQFVFTLSSFAQLSPQFLGKFCFVKELSGIDQLFIHYSHAVAVSLLTLLIVLAARCSVRITVFVRRCIIRVICLLILLSYTSLASTSL